MAGECKENRTLGSPRHRWEDNIKWVFKKWDEAWTGLIWLRRGTGVGLS